MKSAMAVGTTVIGLIQPKAKVKPLKWHCHCLMENGTETFIVIRAASAIEASEKVHAGYPPVEFVLDILTHDQMEARKRHLKPSILGAVGSY